MPVAIVHEFLSSPFVVPLGAFIVVIAAMGFRAWRALRERELDHERHLRQMEMEHEIKVKELALEMARVKGEAMEERSSVP